MSLVELARLNFDRQQHGTAVEYFDRVVLELEASHADTRDPIGYAQILDEYASSLEQTGKNGLAGKFHDRARDLRKAFPGQSSRTDRTPIRHTVPRCELVRGCVSGLMNRLRIQPPNDLIEVEEHRVGAGVGGVAVVVVADIG
jgi:hypothetical protein